MSESECFPIVTQAGAIIGKASRKECHSGTFILHPVVHLHVLNVAGELYLQKRAATKDIQPGKWDTSVGGHVNFGESTVQALRREAYEELCIANFNGVFMLKYKFVSDVEAELIHSFYCVYQGELIINPNEISEGRFWSRTDIENSIGKDVFTPNFEYEYQKIVAEKLLPIG